MMRVIQKVGSMQRTAREWMRQGAEIGFVPTMGYLHAGHMSLVQRARKMVGPEGRVVVSIFVNPTQFGPNEDFSRYPRDLQNDCRLCGEAGVDVVFAPSAAEMYPGQGGSSFSTFVVEEQLSRWMEGVSRPAHFRGVTTIVAKLFNIVRPDVAVFGAKDWQQAAIIKRMVRDLNFPLRLVVAPTRREPDGLAMSSRNKYLEGDLRRQALVLSGALKLAREEVKNAPAGIKASELKRKCTKLISKEKDSRVDYIEFFNPNTLEPEKIARPGTHMALAVFVGKTRLIDNANL